MKELLLSTIIADITAEQERHLRVMTIITAIEPVLKTFDGKKMSKRIETAIQKVLPDNTVFFGKSYSWYVLTFLGNGIEYEDRIEFNLGYFSSGDIFDYKWFTEQNVGVYSNKKRYEELVDVIANHSTELVNRVLDYNQLQEDIQELKDKTKDLPYVITQHFKF